MLKFEICQFISDSHICKLEFNRLKRGASSDLLSFIFNDPYLCNIRKPFHSKRSRQCIFFRIFVDGGHLVFIISGLNRCIHSTSNRYCMIIIINDILKSRREGSLFDFFNFFKIDNDRLNGFTSLDFLVHFTETFIQGKQELFFDHIKYKFRLGELAFVVLD